MAWFDCRWVVATCECQGMHPALYSVLLQAINSSGLALLCLSISSIVFNKFLVKAIMPPSIVNYVAVTLSICYTYITMISNIMPNEIEQMQKLPIADVICWRWWWSLLLQDWTPLLLLTTCSRVLCSRLYPNQPCYHWDRPSLAKYRLPSWSSGHCLCSRPPWDVVLPG